MLNPEAVRIMITGYADIEDVIQAVNRGKIFSYIQKPWNPRDLEVIISTALSHNQLLRERRELIAELQTANAELRRVNAELESRVEQRTRDLNLRNQQLEEANRTISELARRDPLTGLANRRVLDEELNREARRGIRDGRPLSVIILDLDYFKSLNDTFGHSAGDQVLMAVGRILAAGVRPADVVARYGGEEFVILLPDTNLELGVQIAERLRTQLGTLPVADCPRPVTASFGVATLLPGQSADRLIERADAALYRAKANGRNRVEWQPPDTDSGGVIHDS